jgi:hypothetical protein
MAHEVCAVVARKMGDVVEAFEKMRRGEVLRSGAVL